MEHFFHIRQLRNCKTTYLILLTYSLHSRNQFDHTLQILPDHLDAYRFQYIQFRYLLLSSFHMPYISMRVLKLEVFVVFIAPIHSALKSTKKCNLAGQICRSVPLGCNRTTTMCGQQLLLWLLSAHRTVSSKMTAPAQLSAHLNVLFK